jgi:hypothetical protein
MNILNKELWAADKGLSSNLVVGRRGNNHQCAKETNMIETCYIRPLILADYGKRLNPLKPSGQCIYLLV